MSGQRYRTCITNPYICPSSIECQSPNININTQGSTGPAGPTGSIGPMGPPYNPDTSTDITCNDITCNNISCITINNITPNQIAQIGTSNTFVSNQTFTNNIILSSRYILGVSETISQSTTLTFPLYEVYNITPSNANIIDITLPNITFDNVTSKCCFRVTNTGSNDVTLISPISNIFAGSNYTPTNTHKLYNSNNTLTTHTFMALTTSLIPSGYGWFQLGTV